MRCACECIISTVQRHAALSLEMEQDDSSLGQARQRQSRTGGAPW